jgi:hypothetical protein
MLTLIMLIEYSVNCTKKVDGLVDEWIIEMSTKKN